jgi:hypothetical protein
MSGFGLLVGFLMRLSFLGLLGGLLLGTSSGDNVSLGLGVVVDLVLMNFLLEAELLDGKT